MNIILQRVARATVLIQGATVGQIGRGVVLLVGVTHTDTQAHAEWCAHKIAGLRIFPAASGRSGFDRALADVGGAVLVVSQFTLYAETRKGRRPDFGQAAKPEIAAPLLDYFVAQLRGHNLPVATGVFGADMQVELVNDGPVTLVIES